MGKKMKARISEAERAKRERLAKKPMRQRIVDALQRTWDQVQYDVATIGDAGDPEVQRDFAADYLSMYGKDDEAAAAFWKMSPAARERLLAKVFPRARRGRKLRPEPDPNEGDLPEMHRRGRKAR